MVAAGKPVVIVEYCWHLKDANCMIAGTFAAWRDRSFSVDHHALAIEEGDMNGVLHSECVNAVAGRNQQHLWFGRGSQEPPHSLRE